MSTDDKPAPTEAPAAPRGLTNPATGTERDLTDAEIEECSRAGNVAMGAPAGNWIASRIRSARSILAGDDRGYVDAYVAAVRSTAAAIHARSVAAPPSLPTEPIHVTIDTDTACTIGDCDQPSTVCQRHLEDAYASGTADMAATMREIEALQAKLRRTEDIAANEIHNLGLVVSASHNDLNDSTPSECLAVSEVRRLRKRAERYSVILAGCLAITNRSAGGVATEDIDLLPLRIEDAICAARRDAFEEAALHVIACTKPSTDGHSRLDAAILVRFIVDEIRDLASHPTPATGSAT